MFVAGRMEENMEREKEKYLQLLAKEYPTRQAACREIINLNAILNLPRARSIS